MAAPSLSRADLRILRTLQSDAKLTNVELADRIGLSPSPCLRRVRQLEESGMINSYVALLDRRKLGLDVVAFIELQIDRHTDTAAEAFHAAILTLPEVVSCYSLTGTFDYLIKVVVASLDDYASFTMNRLLKIPGIKDLRSSFVLQEIKDSTMLPLGGITATAGG